MNYTFTDANEKTFLYGSIITNEKDNTKKTCICSIKYPEYKKYLEEIKTNKGNIKKLKK